MASQQDQERIHIVIGIIKNSNNEVLISERKANSHLGGLLEFPGGKVESEETVIEALRREMREELSIQIDTCTPIIQIPYIYSDRSVLLDVFLVNQYSGTIISNESQRLYWKKISALSSKEFPGANHGIIRAIQLPNLISVTPNYSNDSDSFVQHFENSVKNETISIIQLRSHDLEKSKYFELAKNCYSICKQYHTRLILNQDISYIDNLDYSGLHLTSKRLLATSKRPLDSDYLVGASCHNVDELQHASKLKLDYVFLGPILEKNSNSIGVLGWKRFKELSQQSELPVYAIGGLNAVDVNTSIYYGGQGIAAVRDLWREN